MKKALYGFVRGMLYTNVFVSLCAMAFVANAYLLLDKPIHTDELILFSGFSTLFTYLLIRLAAVKRIATYGPDVRWNFLLSNLRLLKIVTALALVLCIILFFFLDRDVQIALIIPGLISVFYGIPLGKKFRLRDIGVIKIFLISFVWAYIASVLPAMNAGMAWYQAEVLVLFAADFCFILGITIPFDIKDLQIDEISHVKTIPYYLGIQNAYNLSMILLVASAGLHVYIQRTLIGRTTDFSYPLLTSILIAALIILRTRKSKSDFFYFGLLDGTLLLQFLLCFAYYLLWR